MCPGNSNEDGSSTSISLDLGPTAPTGSGIDGVDVLVADVSDQDSLEAMCGDTAVVIDCVGPVSD